MQQNSMTQGLSGVVLLQNYANNGLHEAVLLQNPVTYGLKQSGNTTTLCDWWSKWRQRYYYKSLWLIATKPCNQLSKKSGITTNLCNWWSKWYHYKSMCLVCFFCCFLQSFVIDSLSKTILLQNSVTSSPKKWCCYKTMTDGQSEAVLLQNSATFSVPCCCPHPSEASVCCLF